MNSSQHRCMNQAPASENQTQQRSLNSSLEATVGSPLVHLGGMLLNGRTSSLPNSPLQPSVTSITYGPCGRGSLVVKVTDLRLACHEFEPSTAEDPPCRKGGCTLNMSRLKRPPVDVVWKLGGSAVSGVVLIT
ncbi:hypothetical protein TNCV_1621061 [Trichonephila clavipes]|nr:hypothetical protein TNCV_1621061 [Trichonephila clavipes]